MFDLSGFPERVKSSKIEEAVKTLRKLPVFGPPKHQTDFEWPTEKELLMMPTDQPIMVNKIRYKIDSKKM